MRIGILGGTFDPPHNGHLALAKAAVNQLCLDRLIFVPANLPPLKDKEELSPAADRLEMIRRAVVGYPQYEVSDCEIIRGGVSYTVDTLEEFRKEYPKFHELYFITGGDWGQNLDRWKGIDRIFSLAHFVVAKRPRFNTKNLPKPVEFLDFVPLDISSTEIRKKVEAGSRVIKEIPGVVLDYILTHGLYESSK